jgi:DNA-binding NarL/FixJ family response regulator
VADGVTATGIAPRLHLPEGTVGNYLSSAIRKPGRNRLEAARVVTDNGWLQTTPTGHFPAISGVTHW